MTLGTAAVEHRYSAPAARVAGVIMISASALSVLLMAHHPSVGSHAIADIVGEIAAKATASRVVHGALIGLILMLVYAFVEFSRRLGLDRAPVRAGLIAYAIGSSAMIGAALTSGFVISDLAAVYGQGRPDDLDALRHLLTLCSLGNRALANFAVASMSAGVLLWAIVLVRYDRAIAWIGVFGLLAGAAPVAALLLGVFRLDVFGMTTVVACQSLWNVAVGIAMARARL